MNSYTNYPPGMYHLPDDEWSDDDELDPEIQDALEALKEQPEDDY